MADVTIYKPAGISLQTIDGDPPVDQTALVAQLQQQLTAAQQQLVTVSAERDSLTGQVTTLQGKINAAKVALA